MMASTADDVSNMLYDLRIGPDLQKHRKARDAMIDALKKIKPTQREVDHKERRRQVHEKSIQVAKLGLIKAELLRDDFAKWSMLVSPMASWDLGVLTKLVIHFQLFGGTLVELGTERHKKWVEMANSGQFIGGFAMTEIGHGSNVQAIETRADYDSSTEEFVLTSPTATSTKFMIGNVGVHGSVIVLMAQLWIGGEKKGVHGFIVRIREEDGSPHCLDGVDVGDVGLKSSWNEVDNAWIRFKGMRIPRENLLNAFADVNKDGSYVSKVSSPSNLFAATLSQLLIGRINYVGAPLIGMQIALNTAIRYANARRQFAANSVDQSPQLETQIMQYTTHYTTLMHFLAKTVALQFSRNAVIGRLSNAKSSPESLAEYHALLSGLKAYVCEWSYISLGHLRVMTGGAGIILSNGIGHLHNFFDVFQTAEGDRTVLYQQLGRYLVTKATKNFQGISGMLHFASQVFSQLLVQYNPILSMVEDNDEKNLFSPGFLLKALELRHLTTIRDLLSKMQTLATAAIPRAPSQIWNDCLLDIISVSDAYLELFVFQQCHDQLTLLKSKQASASTLAEQSTIDTVYACMKTVAAVCGLGFLKEDFQFFMRSGLFSAKRCHFIENAWVNACQQLRDQHCEMLLTSSEMVECFYDAPIGQKDGDYPTHILRTMKPSQAKL